ncbi:response regulator [Pseudomonas sp. DC3200b2]|uniref:response regulator n=1 Tax=Pseudomonas sp. DC3200b2 TaxID=2804669 RepID=UPI003CFB20AA
MMPNALTQATVVNSVESRGKVMVVEDEPIIREFVCEILQSEGFETVDYATADDAWKAFGEGLSVNLLITDIRMPGSIDGAELTHRVHVEWPALPIIVMSGHETPETARLSGDIAFLPKPWTIGKLTDEVMKAIPAAETNLAR